MKILHNSDLQQVAGGDIHYDGLIVHVPNVLGIPDNYFQLIDSTYDQFFSGQITLPEATTAFSNVPAIYLEQYNLCIDSAFFV